MRAASSAAGFSLYRDQYERVRTIISPGVLPGSTTVMYLIPHVSFIINLRRKGSNSCYDDGSIFFKVRGTRQFQVTRAMVSTSTQIVFYTRYRCLSRKQPLVCSTISEPRYLSLDAKQRPTCATYHLNGQEYRLDAVSVTTGKPVSGSNAASVKGPPGVEVHDP